MRQSAQYLVSVVIPCFNSCDTIERAIRSVARQTLLPAEVIVVDDFSRDGSLELVRLLQAELGDQWLKIVALADNVGAGSARNVGWDQAVGDFVAFLDSDDAWHARKIEYQVNWMIAHPSFQLTGHAFCVADNLHIKKCDAMDQPSFKDVDGRSLLLRNKLATPTVMVDARLPFRFEPGKRYSEDYLLWLEICLSGVKCGFSESILAYTFKEDYGAGGLSAHLWQMEIGELDTYRKLQKKRLIGSSKTLAVQSFSLLKFIIRLGKQALKRVH